MLRYSVLKRRRKEGRKITTTLKKNLEIKKKNEFRNIKSQNSWEKQDVISYKRERITFPYPLNLSRKFHSHRQKIRNPFKKKKKT